MLFALNNQTSPRESESESEPQKVKRKGKPFTLWGWGERVDKLGRIGSTGEGMTIRFAKKGRNKGCLRKSQNAGGRGNDSKEPPVCLTQKE